MNHFANFWKDEFGATTVEYGLIGAGISVAIIACAGPEHPAEYHLHIGASTASK